MQSISDFYEGDKLLMSVQSLPFFWQAHFRDGTFINQFSDDGVETNTRDIFSREDELSKFFLISTNDKEPFNVCVDLETGDFCINGLWVKPVNDEGYSLDDGMKFRLIYFMRRWADFGANQREYVPAYYIGWQTTNNGSNKKKLLGLVPEDDGYRVALS